MTRLATAFAFALAALAAPLVAHAGDDAFTQADANGDGAVTMEEVAAVMPATTEEQFIQADADADGALSQEEFTAAMEAGVLS